MKRLRPFLRGADGSATVEFAILFPIVISMLIMGAEAGYTALQRITLERAVDIAVRDVRLGKVEDGTTHDEFRERVCERATLLPGCEDRLLLEMRTINAQTWNFPDELNACIDLAANITPVTPFSLGAGESVMYVRACYLVSPMFPTTALGLKLPLDDAGMFALRATTGFVNE
ncbi:TadE/TadG family type IV pilus assembly protein [Roseinatronobacter sp.]|uniref:TadE/TadG family type IV pilus assembly protein n=1 Tax=Roseinatronobacter sp. TaxID=1945755 RepID=UPI0025D14D04|nr:TadE family protein [Rhodobaca sp.]